jgi:hypothetical protein
VRRRNEGLGLHDDPFGMGPTMAVMVDRSRCACVGAA